MQLHSDKQNIPFFIYYAGLLLLTASLPLSKFGMSLSQFFIFGGWLLSGDFKRRLERFKKAPLAWLLMSVFGLHLLGLIHTTDFDYAYKDLRIKLPLLLLPFVLSTGPRLNNKQFEGILAALIGGALVSSIISIAVLKGIINRPVNDIRDISIFISHIRLSLLCCLSVFATGYLFYRYRIHHFKVTFAAAAVLVVWFIWFIFILESLTGLAVLICWAVLIPVWMLFRSGNWLLRTGIIASAILIPFSVYWYVNDVNKKMHLHESVDVSRLEKTTPSGRPYEHDLNAQQYENGYLVYINICQDELRQEWNKRSDHDYDGADNRGQELKYTLIRFLASKGQKKDSAAVGLLNDSEIKSIEKGIANVDYQTIGSLRSRVHQVLWEIHNLQLGGDPSGHSAAQRFEFWKAAIGIIKDHRWTGVGTGDLPEAFRNQYQKMDSPLSEKWRLRSHNQYLSFAVAFGIPGLLWFLATLLMPLISKIRSRNFLYASFAIAAMVSMITEDTLETQAGVTFFALFNSLFLFVNPQNSAGDGKKGPEDQH
ncbi:MAG: O-antigen ligase family protein [Bacteroidetes bacterium]|nr:O-antigen ligase family protein [Bacteroidota bacterium]